jgi:hypothetical protein
MHAGTPESLNPTHYGCSVNLKGLFVCVDVHTCAHISSLYVNIYRRECFLCVFCHIYTNKCVGVNFMCVSVRMAVCVCLHLYA